MSHPSITVKTRSATLAGAVLGLSFLVVAPAAASTPAADGNRADCATSAGVQARVTSDAADASDPNSLTVAQTVAMQADLRARVAAMKHDGVLNRSGAASRALGAPDFRIRTYVHVITRSDGSGGVGRARVNRQIRVLNKAFAGETAANSARSPFTFTLAGLDYTRNDDWYDWGDPDTDPTDEAQAKAALHRGTKADLNLYVARLSGGLLGYAYYPTDDAGDLDGVVVLNDSLPGGSAAPFNLGDTAPHEVGHWLNLAHTFENGCAAPGDMVGDTPYQADGDNIFSCDESLNTCPQSGKDPVHNFMSYGDDPCLGTFTRGQVRREVTSWLAYRWNR